jgi:hypothetical protein
MKLFIYMLFCISLFFWTVASIGLKLPSPLIEYAIGVCLLMLCLVLVKLYLNKHKQNRIFDGVLIASIFANIGMSINYRCTGIIRSNGTVIEYTYLTDLLLMIFTFVFVYALIRFTKIYRFKAYNLLIMFSIPISIYGARFTSKPVDGSYVYFFVFMIFGIALMGFPFVAAWFLSLDENRYWKGIVGNISWNLIMFLSYTFLIFGGCALCKEFGLLLIVGLTSTTLFFIKCKDKRSKLIYTVTCALGALIASVLTSHLSARIQIWLDPVSAYGNKELQEKAETVLYVFRHFNKMGFWGKGLGNLPSGFYQTLNSDHVLVLLMNDYSIILLGLIIILGILFTKWMFIQPAGVIAYDRYLNLSCALIVALIILVDISSNLGSFLCAGIGYPWVSDGAYVNIMLTALLATHSALLEKGVALNYD